MLCWHLRAYSSWILTAVLQDRTPVPAAQRLQAVINLHMRERAAEEAERIKDDLRNCMLHFVQLHAGLANAINASASAAFRALLHFRVTHIELVMKDIWKVALGHVFDVPDMPLLDTHSPVLQSYEQSVVCDDYDDSDTMESSDEETL